MASASVAYLECLQGYACCFGSRIINAHRLKIVLSQDGLDWKNWWQEQESVQDEFNEFNNPN